MKCSYCGSEIPNESITCPNCGAKVEITNQNNYSNPEPNPIQNYNQATYNNNQTNNTSIGLGIVALVFGILSIISLCISTIGQIIFGFLAILFACIDKGRSGMRKAGLILGIIGLVIGILIIIVTIVGGALLNNAANQIANKYENMSSGDIQQELEKWLEENIKEDEESKEVLDTPSPSEQVSFEGDWAKYTYSDEATEITYQNGVSDDYMMTEKGSFKNLCDWLEYAVPGYPKETLRQLISIYFMNKNEYEDTMSVLPTDYKSISLSTFASLAWQINHDTNGTIKGAKVYYTDPTSIIFEIGQSGSYSLLKWNIQDYTLSIGNSVDSMTSYETTSLNNDTLAVYATAIEHAFNGEKVDA